MKIRHLLFLTLLFLLILQAEASNDRWNLRPVEIRAVWLDRKSIPSTQLEIYHLVEKYAKSGINLIFPEVIFNGYSVYRSSYLEQTTLWGGFDVIQALIHEAHKQGIEVHPWVWVFRAGYKDDKGGILTRHPEWIALDKNGEQVAEGDSYWLCPSHPAVRRLLLGALCELAVKYPVDGIHLDYVRFARPSHCYNENCRRQFEAQYAVDPLNIEDFTKPAVEWHLWRENMVDSLVAEISKEVRKIRPDIKVSAAVVPMLKESRLNYLQDWKLWVDNKWVDFIVPMTYTTNTTNLRKMVRADLETTESRTLIVPGIALHLLKGNSNMLDQIRTVREEAAGGMAFFAGSYLDADELQTLSTGPFAERALLPFRKPIESANLLLTSASSKLKRRNLSEAGIDIQTAKSLVSYASYQNRNIEPILPEPPPIYVPDIVLPIPSVKIPQLTNVPVIDGDISDTCWNEAARICLERTNLGAPAENGGDFLIARDSKKLYFAFRCQGKNQKTLPEGRDTPIFDEDSIEIFIKTGSQNYFHFATNTAGTQYDARVKDPSYNPEWTVATKCLSDGWTAEFMIPLSALDTSEFQNGEWRGNFCRNRLTQTGTEHLCWSPTYGTFHTPSRFGKLIFGLED